MNAIAEPVMLSNPMGAGLLMASLDNAGIVQLESYDSYVNSDYGITSTTLHKESSPAVDMHSAFSDRLHQASHNFSNVENSANLFCSVISQAISDSMPSRFFKSNSKLGLFYSDVPDAYDAYMFLSSDRLDIYAHLLGLDPELHIRAVWENQYAQWRKSHGKAVFTNLIDHLVKLMMTNPPDSVIYMDAKAFQTSPQFVYWCEVGSVDPIQTRTEIMQRLFSATRIQKQA